MKQLSLVVITYNEEENIERCLDSASSVVDEIVVVDSFSEDKTRDLAVAKGARVLTHEFVGFIEQRDYAIQQAKYDQILLLDADEALDDTLRQSVQALRENWTHDCYTMNRLSNLGDQWIHHGAWYPDRKLRLLDRACYEVAGTNPHDKLVPKAGATLKHIKGDLLHYTNSDLKERVETINRFSSVAAKAFYEKGKKGNWLRILFKPGLRFFAEYILKRGFLDGFYGFVIAKTSAQYVFLREVKLYDLGRKE
ncbi:MAG: glycosyltransferase family 2 protein [Bacteroidota bacterium]